MSYAAVAEQVHRSVKNLTNSGPEKEERFPALKENEAAVIKKVFSKYDASADSLTISAIPEGIWG